MALAEAAAVVTTLKNASDLVAKIRNSDSKEELRTGAAALADMLWSARSSALELIEQKALLVDQRSELNEKIRKLEEEVRRLGDFDEQAGKYARIQTRGGKFVYVEKEPAPGSGRPYFCPSCFSNKKIAPLQGRSGDSFHVCPVCQWHDLLEQ